MHTYERNCKRIAKGTITVVGQGPDATTISADKKNNTNNI